MRTRRLRVRLLTYNINLATPMLCSLTIEAILSPTGVLLQVKKNLKKENKLLKAQNDDGGRVLFGLLMTGFVVFYCMVNRGNSKTIQYDTRQLDV